MKQFQLTPQQQQEFGKKMNDGLAKVTMRWTNELRQWHAIALQALNFSSSHSLQIPQQKFAELFTETVHGLNMNVVAVLANAVEARTPAEMGYTALAWAEVLLLNQEVSKRWHELKNPVEQAVIKEFEIMNNRPKLVTMGQA